MKPTACDRHLPALGGAQSVQRGAPDLDRAGDHRLLAGDHPEQRRLAGTVRAPGPAAARPPPPRDRPPQRHHRAGGAAEGDEDVPDLDDRLGRCFECRHRRSTSGIRGSGLRKALTATSRQPASPSRAAAATTTTVGARSDHDPQRRNHGRAAGAGDDEPHGDRSEDQPAQYADQHAEAQHKSGPDQQYPSQGRRPEAVEFERQVLGRRPRRDWPAPRLRRTRRPAAVRSRRRWSAAGSSGWRPDRR